MSLRTKRGTALANMNSKRRSHGFAAFGTKMFAFGGYSSTYTSSALDSIEVYDMVRNIWTVKDGEKIAKTGAASALTVGSRIWVASYYGHIQIWNVFDETWDLSSTFDPYREFKTLRGKTLVLQMMSCECDAFEILLGVYYSIHTHFIELKSGAKGILIVAYELGNEVKFLDFDDSLNPIGAGWRSLGSGSFQNRGYCSANLHPGTIHFIGN